MEKITLEKIAQILLEKDNILVLMHKSPDGDAVGCAYGLCTALRDIGKNAQPLCGDEIPPLFSHVTDLLPAQEFEPEYIVSVDLATEKLLSGKALDYAEKVDLCIDHHEINSGFARLGYVDHRSASCAEIIKSLIDIMGVTITPQIADALFTGVCTDTGCFKFSNTSPATHRIAAELMEAGADSFGICRRFFDTKTKTKLALEKLIYETIEFAADGAVGFVCVTKDMIERSGATQDDLDGIASIIKQVEGVKAGITMREKDGGELRVSVRSSDGINAAEICSRFGGGGHKAAAGCTFRCPIDEAKAQIVGECVKAIEELSK